MSTTSRPLDLILTHIGAHLTGYDKAIMWDEEQAPFTTLTNSIIAVRMQGLATDTQDIRMSECEVHLFSPANSSMAQAEQLYIDATSAYDYCMTNYQPSNDINAFELTQDITGPYRTPQNRFRLYFVLRTAA